MEAGIVPGIYNYCDRWCEKCRFQTSCLSFMMRNRIEEKSGFNLQEECSYPQENIWEFFKNICDSTHEILSELADERGVNVEDFYELGDIDKNFWKDDFCTLVGDDEKVHYQIETSDLVKICLIYEGLVEECLEKVFAILDEKDWIKGSPEERETGEALDVINWNVDVIPIKIRRALYAACDEDYSLKREKRGEEYNGSSKVALIGAENSLKAWETLLKYCPDLSRKISHIQIVLEQLVADIEKKFPDARTFVRPGLDQ